MKALFLSILYLFLTTAASAQMDKKWTALHLLDYSTDADLDRLSLQLPELSKKGINLLILEVDYNFEFESHPELINGARPISANGAKSFAASCKKNNIRLIPEFQCIGHQSWKQNTTSLLKKYPELDLTPGAFPNNDSIYCREWDITNPKVNEIVFALIDEIVAAFDADGIHLGMDEIFLIGNAKSPATFGKNPAKLLAIAINEFHDHFVKEKKLQMMIWGDRLIEATQFNYGAWEASAVGTSSAIDMIPNDIVICDWHYNVRSSYGSIDLFLEKGFKVLPCSYTDVKAAQALIKYSFALQNQNMLGHCFTTWGAVKKIELLDFPAMNEGLNTITKEKYFDVSASYVSAKQSGEIAVQLKSGKKELAIYYTLDGQTPTTHSQKYNMPLAIQKGCTLNAMAYNGEEAAGELFTEEYFIHKGVGNEIHLVHAPSNKYASKNGAATLLNGISGSASFSDGEWVSFEGEDLEAIVTLNPNTTLSSIAMTFHNQVNAWIHHPEKIEIYSSDDGKNFKLIAEKTQAKIGKQTVTITVDFAATQSKFIKVIAKKTIIPEGFTGEGHPAWIFVDEIRLQ